MKTGEEVAIKLVRYWVINLWCRSLLSPSSLSSYMRRSFTSYSREEVIFAMLKFKSRCPNCTLVRCRRRLQRDGDGPAWAESRGPFHSMQEKVQLKDSADAGWPAPIEDRVPPQQPLPAQGYKARQFPNGHPGQANLAHSICDWLWTREEVQRPKNRRAYPLQGQKTADRDCQIRIGEHPPRHWVVT